MVALAVESWIWYGFALAVAASRLYVPEIVGETLGQCARGEGLLECADHSEQHLAAHDARRVQTLPDR